ncbi:MAG: Ig-like domain-containing protein, partial [Bacteroidales bacterium]|nr:Ig-like domain-containing protein [Bacteroidales bacterium]
VDSLGVGYAIVLGNTGDPDPIRFVKYTDGIQSLGTTTGGLIVATEPLNNPTNQFMSLKLTYNPATHVWELLGRVDGSSFEDPMSGELVSVGTVTENEFTQLALPYMGAYWQGSTGGNQTAFFDNVSVWVDIAGAIPPSITNIVQTPPSDITPETTVSVSATVTPGDAAIELVELHWGTDASDLTNTIVMENSGNDTFTTVSDIPAQEHNTTVYFVVFAEDVDGESATSALQSYLVTDPETDLNIVSVINPEPISVETGIVFDDLPLPETVTVTLDNNQIINLDVLWHEGDYDPDTPGNYFLDGDLILTEGIANPENLIAQIEVIVSLPDFSELIAGWFFPEPNQEADQGIPENIGKLISREPEFTGNYTWPSGASPESPSISSTQWQEGENTKYWVVELSTLNFGDLTLSSKQQSSNTGPRDFKVQFRIGTQGAWTDVPNSNITVANNFISGVIENIELPAACNNKAFLYLRWIMTSNTSVNEGTVASAGTSRIDEIEVRGIYSDDFQRIVIGVEELPPFDVVIGTPYEEIDLPETILVYFDDLGSEELPVTWDPGDYDGNTIGTYTITGEIQLLEGMENPDNILAEAIVNVIPEPQFYTVTFNVDMSAATGFDPDADEVYMTGSMFDNAIPGTLPDDQLMSPSGNLIYTNTLTLLEGTYTYKYYINTGVGNPEPGPNRILELTGDMTVDDLWGETNIDEIFANLFNIYPNPASGFVNIQTDQIIKEIRLMDLQGKTIQVYGESDQITRISLPQLTSGLYLLGIRTDNGYVIKKIQINR